MSGFCTTVVASSGSSDNNSRDWSSQSKYSGNWSYKGDAGAKLSKYDQYFKTAGKELDIDWKLVAAHSFKESSWDTNAKYADSLGLYQFECKYWPSYVSDKYKDCKTRSDPEVSTNAYITCMKEKLDKFKNAESRCDQILLALQSFHDGVISGTSWNKVKGNEWTYKKNSRNYVPDIMKKYQKLGGDVQIKK